MEARERTTTAGIDLASSSPGQELRLDITLPARIRAGELLTLTTAGFTP